MRKTLSALLKEVRACRIEDPGRGLNQTDCLGLAVFGMKYLLKFDDAVHSDEAVLSSDAVRCRSRAVGHARTARRNGFAAIAALFHEAVPAFATRKGIGCLRILHPSTEPDTFRRTRCTVKTAAKNTVAQLPTIMLGAGAPGTEGGFPVYTGTEEGRRKKNDCERNAAARLLEDVRREHPHLKLVEDGLAGPHFLKGLDLRLGAKPGDHKFLVGQQRTIRGTPRVHGRERHTAPVRGPTIRTLEVNFLEYWEKHPNGKKQRWVTDLPINKENTTQLMRAGRVR